MEIEASGIIVTRRQAGRYQDMISTYHAIANRLEHVAQKPEFLKLALGDLTPKG